MFSPRLALFAFTAPAGTPQPLVDALGAQPVGDTSAEFKAFIVGERDKWSGVAKSNNIKLN